jgi:hypothetical protein
MIFGQAQVFQVVQLPKNGYSMTKFPKQNTFSMVLDRVLTLVLLGEVEVFPNVYPLKPGVMGEQC